MAFNKSPKAFFGPGYALVDSKIQIPTNDHAGTPAVFTITTPTLSTAYVFTVAAGHNLRPGDKVTLSSTVALPASFLPDTVYYVVNVTTSLTAANSSATVFYLSASKGGSPKLLRGANEVDAADIGSGVYTVTTLSSLAETTDAEADPTAITGDSRKIMFGIIDMFDRKYRNIPIADRPSKVSITRADSTNNDTGEITKSYTIRFTTIPTGIELSDEP